MQKIQEEKLRSYITEISNGNEDALEHFYDEYGRLLLAVIFSIVHNKESAEEVLQDVLMAVVKHPKDKPIGNVKGWLFKVVENISKKRAAEEKQAYAEELPENDEVACEDKKLGTIENSVDQIEAIKILEPLEQRCIAMRIFDGMRLPQVAKLLNMPYGVIRSKYNYAVKKLRKYYEEKGDSV